MKGLIKYLTIPLLIGALNACSPDGAQNRDININGSTYQVIDGDVIQHKSSFLDDGKIKIGVVSDIEGAIKNARDSAESLKAENLDAIILAGDNYENEQLRRNPLYPDSTDNVKEMINGIEPFAQLGIPVFVIPGNHESKGIYNQAIKELQKSYPNVFDIKENSVDLKGVNIVGMGGYHDKRFISEDGFSLSDSDYERAIKDIKDFQKQKEATILVTHGPPKSKTKIDYVPRVGNVGDEKLAAIMNSDIKALQNVHGHIHEGGRNYHKYKAGIATNVAAITDYNNEKGPYKFVIRIRDDKLTK